MKDNAGQDAELRAILRRNDPAGLIDPTDSARLEMLIADRIFYQAQPQMQPIPMGDFFLVPHLLRGILSWPAVLTGTMVLGLMLGLCVASFSDTGPEVSYNVAMNGPWQHLMH